MSKLKCSYWDSNAFSHALHVLFWMKNNACPLPPTDNGKGEQWAEKGERGKKAGKGREEPIVGYCTRPALWAAVTISQQGGRARGQNSLNKELRICLQCRRPQFDSWVRKIPWRRDRLPTPVFLGFPGGSAGKESSCNVGDLGSIPGLGKSSAEGNSIPQYTPVFRLGDFHGRYSWWGHKESDTTEWLSLSRSSGSHRDSESAGGESFLS